MDTIINTFDTWITAQGVKSKGRLRSIDNISLEGIKRLRELILELAVRGKLEPQNPSDESASKLLTKINDKKNSLLEQGIIKKEKAQPIITGEEEPYELPEGWKWVRLQHITAYIQRGKGPQYAESGRVLVASQKCVQWEGFDIAKARFIDDGTLDVYEKERYIQKHDILWNSTGTGTVGRVAIIDEAPGVDIVADSHVTIIRPIIANSRFIGIFLATPGIQKRIEPNSQFSLVSGSTKQVELNRSTVLSLVVPLPPIEEQYRIVSKVNELMAACDELERAETNHLKTHETLVRVVLDGLTASQDAEEFEQAWQRVEQHFDVLFTTEDSIEQLKQTILKLAVMGKLVEQDPNDEPAGELLKNIDKEKKRLIDEGLLKKDKPLPPVTDKEKQHELPPGWAWARLNDFIDVRDGTHDSPKDANGDDTYPLITSKNFVDGNIDFEGARRISAVDHMEISKRSKVDVLDILFSMIGGNLGNQVIVEDTQPFSIKNVALFKYYSRELTYPYFIKKYLEHIALDLQSRASGGAQPFVSLGFLRNLVIGVPPVTEQHRIVTKVNELVALCDNMKAGIKKSDKIKNQMADSILKQID